MYDELVKRLREDAPTALVNCDFDFVVGWIEEAANAIEELVKESERWQVEAKDWYLAYMGLLPTRWIPVTERLPEEPGTYLVVVKEPKKWTERRVKGEAEEWDSFDFSHVEPAFYNNDQSVWCDDDVPMNANLDTVNTYEAFHVTHWMPLPQPPKEE